MEHDFFRATIAARRTWHPVSKLLGELRMWGAELEQQAAPKLTKMAWEGSGCGMRSCVLVSASWRARNLARPDTC